MGYNCHKVFMFCFGAMPKTSVFLWCVLLKSHRLADLTGGCNWYNWTALFWYLCDLAKEAHSLNIHLTSGRDWEKNNHSFGQMKLVSSWILHHTHTHARTRNTHAHSRYKRTISSCGKDEGKANKPVIRVIWSWLSCNRFMFFFTQWFVAVIDTAWCSFNNMLTLRSLTNPKKLFHVFFSEGWHKVKFGCGEKLLGVKDIQGSFSGCLLSVANVWSHSRCRQKSNGVLKHMWFLRGGLLVCWWWVTPWLSPVTCTEPPTR